jgi:hypothetical protein
VVEIRDDEPPEEMFMDLNFLTNDDELDDARMSADSDEDESLPLPSVFAPVAPPAHAIRPRASPIRPRASIGGTSTSPEGPLQQPLDAKTHPGPQQPSTPRKGGGSLTIETPGGQPPSRTHRPRSWPRVWATPLALEQPEVQLQAEAPSPEVESTPDSVLSQAMNLRLAIAESAPNLKRVLQLGEKLSAAAGRVQVHPPLLTRLIRARRG